jgi:hypothetical protein
MVFDMFKKKTDDDDFSDFLPGKKDSTPDHMGLPLNGDITETGINTNSSNDAIFNPLSANGNDSFPSKMVDSPSSFRDLNEMNQNSIKQSSSGGDLSSRLSNLDKDMQLLNVKMDAVRAVLENINQRMARIEKLAEDSKAKPEETIRW